MPSWSRLTTGVLAGVLITGLYVAYQVWLWSWVPEDMAVIVGVAGAATLVLWAALAGGRAASQHSLGVAGRVVALSIGCAMVPVVAGVFVESVLLYRAAPEAYFGLFDEATATRLLEQLPHPLIDGLTRSSVVVGAGTTLWIALMIVLFAATALARWRTVTAHVDEPAPIHE